MAHIHLPTWFEGTLWPIATCLSNGACVKTRVAVQLPLCPELDCFWKLCVSASELSCLEPCIFRAFTILIFLRESFVVTARLPRCSDVCLHLSSLQYCLFSNQSKDNGQGFSAL